MKRSLGVGSKLSSYQYGAKKTVWKWTAGKIIAFSTFGVLMTALIYIESSNNSSVYQDSIQSYDRDIEDETLSAEFEQEYQEFLSKGRKIVPQDLIDSLALAKNASFSSEEDVQKLPVPAGSTVSSQPSPVEQKPAKRTPSSSNVTNNDQVGVENNLRPVPLTSLNNKNPNTGNISTLEEVDPLDLSNRSNATVSQSTTEEVIVEEFYTEDVITGTIAALSDRTPLIGVIVMVKGTDIETVTDSTGKYSIKVPGDPLYRTVRYSYRGNSTERDVAPGTEILNVRF